MAYQSPLLNVMIAAARKAGRPLTRDFGELENLQISKKGPADLIVTGMLEAQLKAGDVAALQRVFQHAGEIRRRDARR